MANYHIRPIAWKTGTQTPGWPNLENGDGILYFYNYFRCEPCIFVNKKIYSSCVHVGGLREMARRRDSNSESKDFVAHQNGIWTENHTFAVCLCCHRSCGCVNGRILLPLPLLLNCFLTFNYSNQPHSPYNLPPHLPHPLLFFHFMENLHFLLPILQGCIFFKGLFFNEKWDFFLKIGSFFQINAKKGFLQDKKGGFFFSR